ncbi:hypothetical protein JXL83_02160 [candidate division WOR-3 bacterium]|nr:hypothetical protein [candidate division WOR-3 bacterium]
MIGILFSLLIGSNSAHYMINGNFEQDLSLGWEQFINAWGAEIIRGTNFDPDPDFEVKVIKPTGGGHVILGQIAFVPTTDIVFSADIKLFASATSTSWSAAALVIGYIDAENSLLGETRICDRTSYCPWISTPTIHLMEATDSMWHYYTFNLSDELTNLSGINPDNVQKIRIELLDTSYNC